MKRNHRNLYLPIAAILTLASCGGQSSSITSSSSSAAEQSCPTCDPCSSAPICSACDPCSSEEPTRITYGHYTLKEGVTDLSEIEGYPWINSSIGGMLGKVEKPEAKHDFFGYANYEAFEENPLPEGSKRAGGKIFESSDVTDDHIDEIMSSDNAAVKATLELLRKGAKEKILEDVADLLNPDTSAIAATNFLSSKALFEGPSRLITMQVDEEGKIRLSFGLNFENINALLALYIAYASQKVPEYFYALVDYMTLTGLDEETAGTIFNSSLATIVPGCVAASKSSILPHETTVGEMDFDFGPIDLKAALLDAGFADNDELSMTDQAYLFLTYLGNVDLMTLGQTIAFTRMYDNRYLVGAADFRNLALTQFAGLQGLEFKQIDGDSDDEEVARALYIAAFPKAFDQVYIDRFVKATTKERIDSLIDDIIDEYQVLLEEQSWLGEETKQAAKDKLSNMWHMAFYSDGFMDEANRFKVTATDAVGLADAYYDWYAGINATCPWSGNILAGSVSTTDVNAMYSTTDNAFAIYHGVCSSYIEDENLSTEKLFGFIGLVIGHEISHGFDSTGANYDLNGQMHDWWTPEDRAAFQSKVDSIAEYYTNDLHGFHDHNYNGAKLTGEVIADMGGVRIMLRLAQKEESFDYDEFFRAFAENFAIQQSREYGISRITDDMHPEEHLRINVTLSQFDEFLNTYDVKEGDGMYVAPADRLAIW